MQKQISISGSSAIVTGGASGMGQATAQLFAEHGARVLVVDIDADGAERTAASIRSAGGDATTFAADIGKADDVKAMVAAAVERHGKLDFALNVAGIASAEGGVLGCPVEEWDQLVRVNLTGTFLCLKYQAEAMLPSGGAIVNFSSVGGLIGNGAQPGYVATKHGVIGLTKAAAIELGGRGIRVNAICPGFIRTPMSVGYHGGQFEERSLRSSPLARAAEPREVAEAALWLCTGSSSFVNGTAMVVDGGMLSGVAM